MLHVVAGVLRSVSGHKSTESVGGVMRLPKRTIPIGIGLTLAVVAGVVGYAYFTGEGTGTGSAEVGTASPWDVTDITTAGPALLPNSGTQTVSYTITNASDGQQSLNAVEVTLADDGGNVLNSEAEDAPVEGCLVSWFVVDNTGAPTTPASLAGGASVTGSATVTMSDPGVNQNACQGVSPQIIVTAS
jgi:hypothetical protein